jgi:hypothetical protein
MLVIDLVSGSVGNFRLKVFLIGSVKKLIPGKATIQILLENYI